tara:strand:+ start:1004 stop:2479 length:1476 start_codon:yes stop_codon:yes gene_type:complete
MSHPSYFLGIDLGSSSVKTSLFDSDKGDTIDSITYPEKEMKIVSKKKGWAEQDPNYWWQCIEKCLITLKNRNNFDLVKSIGISYQMHGLVAINNKGEPLIPSIIWCDSRAVEIGKNAEKEINKDIIEKHILNSPGNFTASKIKWVMENDPETYSEIYKVMLPGDYIVYKLTGKISTTSSGLSEGILWDFHTNSISKEVLDHYNINPNFIPEIVDSIGNQGDVTDEICKKLDFKKGIKISYRTGDQPNNAFSLNVLNPGEIAATAGTSAVIYSVTDKNIYDPNNRINTFLHCNSNSLKSRNGLLLCINGSGIAFSWIKSLLKESSYKEMDFKAEKVSSSEGVKFYSFGNGAERLFENRKIDSHLIGLDFNVHSNEHIIRATLEGIAFSLSYGIELLRRFGVDVNTVRVGNANLFLSKVFREAFVSSSKVKLQLYDTNGSEGAARGAALGYGFYKDEKEAFQKLKMISEINPSKEDFYTEEYRNWKNILNKLN